MATLKISKGKIVDIDSGYDRVVGTLHMKEDGYYFRKSPTIPQLTIWEQEQLCYIMDSLNNQGEN